MVNQKNNKNELNEKKVFYINESKWNALGTVATFFAVIVALFMPFWQDYNEYRNIKSIIESEVNMNKEIINNLKKVTKKDIKKFNSNNINKLSILAVRLGYIKNLETKEWEEYKKQLAVHDSEIYKNYKEIYSYINNLKKYRLNLLNAEEGSQKELLNKVLITDLIEDKNIISNKNYSKN